MSYKRAIFTSILILLAGTLTGTPALAQQAIPVSVFTRSGKSLPKLSGANFKATYKGKKVRVRTVTADHLVHRIVLLIDVSDSMLGRYSDADWDYPLNVAQQLLSAMPSNTAIGLAAFGTGLQHVISPTIDRKKVVEEVERVRKAHWSFSQGDQADTSIRDAIIAGAKMFDHPQLGDVLYVITDGFDNTSEAGIEDVYQALACRGIRLFSFIVSPRAVAFGEPPMMRELSGDTGGYAIVDLLPSASPDGRRDFVDKSGKVTPLGEALVFQYRAILDVYRISADLPEVRHKRQDWHLDFSSLDTAGKNDWVLIYPHKFEMCD